MNEARNAGTNHNGVGHARHCRTKETILDQSGAVDTTTLPPMRRRATTATWRLREKPLLKATPLRSTWGMPWSRETRISVTLVPNASLPNQMV